MQGEGGVREGGRTGEMKGEKEEEEEEGDSDRVDTKLKQVWYRRVRGRDRK